VTLVLSRKSGVENLYEISDRLCQKLLGETKESEFERYDPLHTIVKSVNYVSDMLQSHTSLSTVPVMCVV